MLTKVSVLWPLIICTGGVWIKGTKHKRSQTTDMASAISRSRYCDTRHVQILGLEQRYRSLQECIVSDLVLISVVFSITGNNMPSDRTGRYHLIEVLSKAQTVSIGHLRDSFYTNMLVYQLGNKPSAIWRFWNTIVCRFTRKDSASLTPRIYFGVAWIDFYFPFVTRSLDLSVSACSGLEKHILTKDCCYT